MVYTKTPPTPFIGTARSSIIGLGGWGVRINPLFTVRGL